MTTFSISASISSASLTTTSNPLVIPIAITQQISDTQFTSVATAALIDSGATSCFIDSAFADSHQLRLSVKDEPVPLYVIDGRPIASGAVTHSCSTTALVQNSKFKLELDVTVRT